MVRMAPSQGVDMGSIPMQAAIFAGRAAVLVLRTDFQSVDTSSILVRPAKVLGVCGQFSPGRRDQSFEGLMCTGS